MVAAEIDPAGKLTVPVTVKFPATATFPFAERSDPATNLLENVFTPATDCAVVKST